MVSEKIFEVSLSEKDILLWISYTQVTYLDQRLKLYSYRVNRGIRIYIGQVIDWV